MVGLYYYYYLFIFTYLFTDAAFYSLFSTRHTPFTSAVIIIIFLILYK